MKIKIIKNLNDKKKIIIIIIKIFNDKKKKL